MRLVSLLVLALLSLPVPAQAQHGPMSGPKAPPLPSGLSNGQEIALFGVPILATAGTVALLAGSDAPGVVFVLPLVPAVATCATGAAAGIGGDCPGTFRSTLLWSLPGYALIGIGVTQDSWDGLGTLLLGGFWLTFVPPFVAIESYRRSAERDAFAATPALVSDPATHRLAPGVRLRLGL